VFGVEAFTVLGAEGFTVFGVEAFTRSFLSLCLVCFLDSPVHVSTQQMISVMYSLCLLAWLGACWFHSRGKWIGRVIC
jgi:hypothetical protein